MKPFDNFLPSKYYPVTLYYLISKGLARFVISKILIKVKTPENGSSTARLTS